MKTTNENPLNQCHILDNPPNKNKIKNKGYSSINAKPLLITDKHIPLCTEDESDKRNYYEKKV